MEDQSKPDISFTAQTATDFGQSYFLAIDYPPQTARMLEGWMQKVVEAIGDGLYLQPAPSLHISVLDFVDSFTDPVDFGYKNKAAVWTEIGGRCETAVQDAIKNLKPFDITFGEFVVTDAAIILKGQDNGQIAQLRADIMAHIGSLRLPSAKNPPVIIHSSLARYTKVMPLAIVRRALADQKVNFALHVDHVTVRHQVKMNMLESEVVKLYDLT